ncbi:MAG: hypothetical protein JWR63_3405 [Conexibacter sp.]|nr:hypothetical protein [Conexibacter sp.]
MSQPSKETFLSRIFDQRPGRHRPRHMTNGAVTMALTAGSVLVALTVGFTRDIPFWNAGSEIKAEFRSTPNLRVGYPVRVRGVNVGKVKSVTRDAARDVAIVKMEIDSDQEVTLKQDAHAAVSWRTLLGRNMFVDLDPGSPSAPKLGSDTIPVKQTEAQVEFDQLLAPLDKTGRGGIQTFFRQFDTAFRDSSAPGRNLDRLAPSIRPVGPAVDALRGQGTGDLGRVVDNARKTMAAFGASEAKLVGLVDGADITFGVTAAERASLGSFVRHAPATLRETRQTMVRLRTTLDLLDPVASRARPGLRRLDETTRNAGAALVEATPLLADLRPLSDRLRGALDALGPASTSTVKFMDGLDPTLTRAGGTLVPWLKAKNRLGIENGQTFGPTASIVASSAGQFGGAGTHLRFQGLASGAGGVGLPCATGVFDPGKKDQLLDCTAFFRLLQGSTTMKHSK